MENKSILLVVGSILLSGMMIASAIVYNGSQSSSTIGSQRLEPQQQADPVQATGLEVELSEQDPYQGNKEKAQVVIMEFSDYECPFCKRFHDEARPEIVSQYVDTDQAILVWKDLPLSFHDPLATEQAVAAQCSNNVAGNEQYFEFSNEIFAFTKAGNGGAESEDLIEIAQGIEGLDFDTWNECYESENTLDLVEANKDLAAELGVTGTPGFIIGKLEDGKLVDGVRIAGALPFETFAQSIDQFLQ